MTRLIDDLLDVSRIATGKLELQRAPAALAGILAQAVEASRPYLDAHGHTLTVIAADPALHVWADAMRLAQVFMNLLVNAAKFTPPGGHIRLAVDAPRPAWERHAMTASRPASSSR